MGRQPKRVADDEVTGLHAVPDKGDRPPEGVMFTTLSTEARASR
jgi:hypothetical protein